MRKLMNYSLHEYREDWDTALAIALLMGEGKEHFEPMLESCMQRILAFQANNPEVIPFERYSL